MTRLPFRLHRPLVARGGLVLADQGLSTASNGLFAFSIATTVSASAYGSFALSYAVLGAGLMMWRRGVLLEISIRRHAATELAAVTAEILRLLLVLTPVIVVVPLVVLALAGVGISRESVALAAIGPIVLAQDTLRVSTLAGRCPRRVLVSDGLWLALTAMIFLGAVTGTSSYAASLAMWCVAAVLALLVLVARSRPNATRSLGIRQAPFFLGRGQRRRVHNATTGSLSPLTFMVVMAIIGRLAGGTVVAALAGTALLMFPITILLSSIPLLLSSRTEPNGPSARRIRELVGVCVTVTVCWLLVLLVMPDAIGAALLGSTWVLVAPLLALGALAAGAQAIEGTLVNALQLRGLSRVPLALGTFSNVTRLTYATVLSVTIGTATAILGANLVLSAVVAVLSLAALRRNGGPLRIAG